MLRVSTRRELNLAPDRTSSRYWATGLWRTSWAIFLVLAVLWFAPAALAGEKSGATGKVAGGRYETSAQTSVKIARTYQSAALSKDVLLFAPSAADQHAHSHGKP